jgi:asparagine synthase (glutamine-hydrolysing)
MSYEEAVVVVRESFEAAVVKREMADVPSGVLLSGGLDSSIVAAVMSRRTLGNHTTPQNETLMLEDSRLQSFSIGLKGSPDHAAARIVAAAIGRVNQLCMISARNKLRFIRYTSS